MLFLDASDAIPRNSRGIYRATAGMNGESCGVYEVRVGANSKTQYTTTPLASPRGRPPTADQLGIPVHSKIPTEST